MVGVWRARLALSCGALLGLSAHALAQSHDDPVAPPPGAAAPSAVDSGATEPVTPPPPHPTPHVLWLDRTHQGLYDFMWHTAMRVDRWFGSDKDEADYKTLYGSIAPAVLWDRHYGAQLPFRFDINLPLPQLNQRFNAFVGRFDPSEYISEQSEPSGAFRRQYGPSTQDQTVLGIVYHEPERQGGYWDAGAGGRPGIHPDGYVKGSWVYLVGTTEHGLLAARNTAFYEISEGAGVTTRLDMERLFEERWLLRWTSSLTYAQRTLGVAAWSSVGAMRGFKDRRAVVAELEVDGQTDAPVPLHSYGAKVGYRQGIARRWLIIEIRGSLAWPKDLPVQHRVISPGLGLGFEMLFGTDRFLARPVTF